MALCVWCDGKNIVSVMEILMSTEYGKKAQKSYNLLTSPVGAKKNLCETLMCHKVDYTRQAWSMHLSYEFMLIVQALIPKRKKKKKISTWANSPRSRTFLVFDNIHLCSSCKKTPIHESRTKLDSISSAEKIFCRQIINLIESIY